MGEVAGKGPLTFNGSLEAGIRAVAILGAAYPASFDVQRLTALDYLIVRTEQLGGPNDLHPDSPIRAPITLVRREVVQRALSLMMTRDLVTREVNKGGIWYRAGETATVFLNSMRAPYLVQLISHAKWLVGHTQQYDDVEFQALMRNLFDHWVYEFQTTGPNLDTPT